MSGVILRTKATRVVQRGAYTRYFTQKIQEKDPYGRIKEKKVRMMQRMPECEAVEFKCPNPRCGKKNCQSILLADVITKEILQFKCYRCERLIEVEKPNDESPQIIIPGIETAKHIGLYGPDNRMIG